MGLNILWTDVNVFFWIVLHHTPFSSDNADFFSSSTACQIALWTFRNLSTQNFSHTKATCKNSQQVMMVTGMTSTRSAYGAITTWITFIACDLSVITPQFLIQLSSIQYKKGQPGKAKHSNTEWTTGTQKWGHEGYSQRVMDYAMTCTKAMCKVWRHGHHLAHNTSMKACGPLTDKPHHHHHQLATLHNIKKA